MELKDRGKGCYSRGGGGTYFPFFTEGHWGFFVVRAVGAVLIRTTALTRRQTASVKARLKKPYIKFKCPAQLTTFVVSNRCNYTAVYARNILHCPFRRKLSLLLIVSCYPS